MVVALQIGFNVIVIGNIHIVILIPDIEYHVDVFYYIYI
jgi:hypothetical protein